MSLPSVGTVLFSVIFALAAGEALPQTPAAMKTGDDRQSGFVYRTPQGVEFEVTAAGLSAIRAAAARWPAAAGACSTPSRGSRTPAARW